MLYPFLLDFVAASGFLGQNSCKHFHLEKIDDIMKVRQESPIEDCRQFSAKDSNHEPESFCRKQCSVHKIQMFLSTF